MEEEDSKRLLGLGPKEQVMLLSKVVTLGKERTEEPEVCFGHVLDTQEEVSRRTSAVRKDREVRIGGVNVRKMEITSREGVNTEQERVRGQIAGSPQHLEMEQEPGRASEGGQRGAADERVGV